MYDEEKYVYHLYKWGKVMADNYRDTALMMYESSETLFILDQWHLGSYLAGYVVECVMKSILKSDKPNLNLRYHLNDGNNRLVGDIQFLLQDLSIRNPGLLNQIGFLDSSNADYPYVIINGGATTNGKIIERWVSHYRYDPSVWNDADIAQVFQNEIKKLQPIMNNLIVGGLMRL